MKAKNGRSRAFALAVLPYYTIMVLVVLVVISAYLL